MACGGRLAGLGAAGEQGHELGGVQRILRRPGAAAAATHEGDLDGIILGGIAGAGDTGGQGRAGHEAGGFEEFTTRGAIGIFHGIHDVAF